MYPLIEWWSKKLIIYSHLQQMMWHQWWYNLSSMPYNLTLNVISINLVVGLDFLGTKEKYWRDKICINFIYYMLKSFYINPKKFQIVTRFEELRGELCFPLLSYSMWGKSRTEYFVITFWPPCPASDSLKEDELLKLI